MEKFPHLKNYVMDNYYQSRQFKLSKKVNSNDYTIKKLVSYVMNNKLLLILLNFAKTCLKIKKK